MNDVWESILLQIRSEAAEAPQEPDRPEPLEKDECICGEIKCKDEYVHWTSGF